MEMEVPLVIHCSIRFKLEFAWTCNHYITLACNPTMEGFKLGWL
jgi:hypothetical protein